MLLVLTIIAKHENFFKREELARQMPGKKRVRNVPRAKPADEDLSQLSVDDLRKQLVEIGETPGPIDASNK